MSPRRSSRARLAHSSNGLQQNQSSASSTSSGRAERQTRSYNKASSPQKAPTSRSRSSEESTTLPAKRRTEQQHTRRRRLNNDDEDDTANAAPPKTTDPDGSDEDETEDEVTRCVCGLIDYPGPPDVGILGGKNDTSAHSPKESGDPPQDEIGSLFIQCDICKVWQHGGCVGIMELSMSPEEYFCELCRGDLHEIISWSKGHRSSRYLPVVGPSSPKPARSTSISKENDFKLAKAKSGNQAANSHASKRRSTLNSREAAYDEEEELRRAIEESKAEKEAGQGASKDRKGKRERSDSDETKQGPVKRQRTTSRSTSSLSHPNVAAPSQTADSDQEQPQEKSFTGNGSKRVRGAAARTQQKESRERVAEKDKDKVEPPGRRKGRAERRREDSDPLEEFPKPRQTTIQDTVEPAAPPVKESPPAPKLARGQSTQVHAPNGASATRKTGRAHTRKSRAGRNQYTRDRDLARDPSSARSQSRDGRTGDEVKNPSSASSTSQANQPDTLGKSSRPRYMMNPQRTTLNEMKRRVGGILEFISRVQVEMAGERMAGPGTEDATRALMQSLADEIPDIAVTTADSQASAGGTADSELLSSKAFAELNSLEMMDVLTRKLVLWQKEFGKWGEK